MIVDYDVQFSKPGRVAPNRLVLSCWWFDSNPFEKFKGILATPPRNKALIRPY